jgi:hypothetical protein
VSPRTLALTLPDKPQQQEARGIPDIFVKISFEH